MLGALFVLLCLVAPFLIMWHLIRVQRRVKEIMRVRREEERREARVEEPWVEAQRGADGYTYARAYSPDDQLLAAARKADESDIFKDLEGRR